MSSPFLHPVFVWLQLYPADLSNNTDPCTDPNAPRQVAAWRTAHALVQATQGTGPTLDVDTSSAISCTLNNFTISEEPSDGCLKALWQCFDGSTPGDSLNFKFQLHFDIFTLHGRRAFPAPDSLPSSSSLLIPPKSLIWTECSALTAPTRKSRTLASGNQAATPRRWPVGMSANSFGCFEVRCTPNEFIISFSF